MLVVDDKRIERRGIAFLVAEYALPIQVVEAENGVQALEYIKQNPVDILFTDIRMPVGDGLSLAAEVRKICPDIILIFFSAYSDFDYARRAIALGAYRYLLKPLDINEFLQVIGDALETCRNRQQAKEALPGAGAPSSGMLEKALMDLISGPSDAAALQSLAHRLHEHGVPIETKPLRLILIESRDALSQGALGQLQDMAENCLMGRKIWLELDERRILVVLVPGDLQATDALLLRALEQLQQNIQAEFGRPMRLALSAGIGHAGDMASAYEALENVAEMGFFAEEGRVLAVGSGLQGGGPEVMERIMKEIDERIQGQDMAGVGEAFDMLFDYFRAQGAASVIYTKFVCSEIIARLVRACGLSQDEQARIVENLFSAENINQLQQHVRDIIARAEATSSEESEAAAHRLVSEVMDIVAREYMNDISVDSLARQVYRSPNYLGRVFKKVTGTALSKYITHYRLEQSRELLRRKDIMISEIAKRCGYQDYSYFGLLFRNYFGISPTLYRQQQQAQEEPHAD
nr:response regulator [bacterium]